MGRAAAVLAWAALAESAAVSVAACSEGRARPETDAARDGGGAAAPAPAPAPSGSGARDSAATVTLVRVNRGTHGMAARTRWARSVDGATLLVVEDPYGVENEPVPNAFVLAGEVGGRRVQMDSVWDVAPSPDFTRAAFGRAYVMGAGEGNALPAARWEALARRAGMPVADVRRGAFAASGMSLAVGFAQPGVVALERGTVARFPVAAGWRVGWSEDGTRIAAGTAPRRIGDDAPAASWIALDAATGMPVGRLPAGARPATVAWAGGPTIGIGLPVDTLTPRSIPVAGGVVESRAGWIRVRGRVVGRGVALAATRGGRVIAALVPEPGADEGAPPLTLAVYLLER